MQLLENYLEKHQERTFALLILLAIPAFFTNLGLLPLFADEPTRASVALEMIISKNYSVPTIGNEYYYNKPPVYNWILAGAYLLTGTYSEFVTRLPAEIPMFLFAITIFISVRYFLQDKRMALVSGMFFMLSGRMLLYDSMLGHIDIFYSWLTYMSFMCIFYFYQKQQWLWLFLSSYLITAVTFLCKGMPSIVFQGFTILTLLIYTRNIKRFFSWQHIVSGLSCVAIIALYFYNYSRYNSNLSEYFLTIWDQSSRRTAGNVEASKSLKHLFTFPFEHLGHLFPASLMMLFSLNRDFIKHVCQTPFLKYISLIFLVNISVYWLSPETRPRYLLMLYPLVIIIASYSYYTWRDRVHWLKQLFNGVLILSAVVALLSLPLAALFRKLPGVPYITFKVLLLTLIFSLLAWLIIRFRNKIIPFMVLLIFVRLTFSWFVLPERAGRHEGNAIKKACAEMAGISAKRPFFLYQYHPEELSLPYHHRIIFYLERDRFARVSFSEEDSRPGYYLTFDRDLKNPQAKLLKTYEGNLKLFMVQ